MEIKYSEDVKLVVNITDKMVSDYQLCQKNIEDNIFNPDICKTCSLNVDMGDFNLCDVPQLKDKLKFLHERRTKDVHKN